MLRNGAEFKLQQNNIKLFKTFLQLKNTTIVKDKYFMQSNNLLAPILLCL